MPLQGADGRREPRQGSGDVRGKWVVAIAFYKGVVRSENPQGDLQDRRNLQVQVLMLKFLQGQVGAFALESGGLPAFGGRARNLRFARGAPFPGDRHITIGSAALASTFFARGRRLCEDLVFSDEPAFAARRREKARERTVRPTLQR